MGKTSAITIGVASTGFPQSDAKAAPTRVASLVEVLPAVLALVVRMHRTFSLALRLVLLQGQVRIAVVCLSMTRKHATLRQIIVTGVTSFIFAWIIVRAGQLAQRSSCSPLEQLGSRFCFRDDDWSGG